MIVTVLHNQSILDIAIQYTGMVENSFDIAVYNGLSLSDILVPGTTIEIPDDLDNDYIPEVDNDVVEYFSVKMFEPAFEQEINTIVVNPLAGINYWEIEETFEIQ
ncbi:hypothetical protein [Chryseobacterium sp.]|uniref:hypothetical protein n=1 Tax=Chryseobacterium sp. TaxID=1871047 RepID=UPI002FC9D1FF